MGAKRPKSLVYNNSENAFLRWVEILMENKIKIKKNLLLNYFFKFNYIVLRHFSTVFRRFLREFPIFFKPGFRAGTPINRHGHSSDLTPTPFSA